MSKRMKRLLGLTIPQRLTLLLIGQNPGILVSQLAAIRYLNRGTLSGIVRRLEEGEYVERTVDARDSRRAGLTLTAKGRSMNRRREGTFEDAARRVLAATRRAQREAAEDVLVLRLASELRELGDRPA